MMNLLRRFGVGPRLLSAFLMLAAVTFAVGLYGVYNLRVANELSSAMYRNNVLAIADLADAKGNIMRHSRALLRAGTQIDDAGEREKTLSRVAGYLEAEKKAWASYAATVATGDEAKLQLDFANEYPKYVEVSETAARLIRNGDRAALSLINTEVKDRLWQVEAMLDQLMANNRDQAANAAQAGAEQAASVLVATWVAIAGAVLFAIAMGLLLTRSITTPTLRVIEAARRIADKNLSEPVAIDGNDELTQMSTALRDMQEGLHTTLQSMSSYSNQLAAASEELNVVTEDMSRVMTTSNDQLHMAATAVTEMSAAVDEVARSATQTSESSASAENMVMHGRKQVTDTKGAIDELTNLMSNANVNVVNLTSQVDEVTSVLDVIRAIAEQTNLLALNAAIEAARAGEAGRGFSVVADEVRALAARTQESTREITGILDKVKTASSVASQSMDVSNEKAQETRELADNADGALEQIATAISRINEMNVTIASASEEQAATAREVDRNLVTIKDASTQNSTAALQINASSNELARIAAELNLSVNAFQL